MIARISTQRSAIDTKIRTPVRSYATTPMTLSTRFAMRSARRSIWLSTCSQAALALCSKVRLLKTSHPDAKIARPSKAGIIYGHVKRAADASAMTSGSRGRQHVVVLLGLCSTRSTRTGAPSWGVFALPTDDRLVPATISSPAFPNVAIFPRHYRAGCRTMRHWP